MAQQYRYPGAKPFQTDESHVFYGRAAVSQDLYQLVRLEPLVVLHAKSGLGKSSLINAGLMPIVKEAKEYQSFSIRFHAFTAGKKEVPLSITRNVIQSQSTLLEKIRPEGDDSLWYHLKSRQIAAADDKGILLVFDQFEELFTYDDTIIKEFARQLSEALYTTLPQRYRDQRRAGFEKDKNFLSEAELALLDQPLNLRLLMAIRSDRMSLMKKVKAYFPTILSADFELEALDREQAEDAILSPAYQKVGFLTPVFDYQDDAIEYLLDFLSEGGTEPIESFQLQILCEYVEQYLVEQQGKVLIAKSDIANPDLILENYYLGKIESIANPTDQLAARRLIEEGFIFEEEERRLTLYEGQIFRSYGVSRELLNQLLDTHLIRSEPSLRGGYTYELSHDTLVGPVLKAKKKRKLIDLLFEEDAKSKEREAELLALRKKEETALQQAKKEKKLRTIAESNEKRATQRTRLAMGISLIALLLLFLSYFSYRNAEEKKAQAEAATTAAQNTSLVFQMAKKNPTLALRIADYNIEKNPENSAAATAFREVLNDKRNRYFKREFRGSSTDRVLAVAFSPDGQTILTGESNNKSTLWDLSGKELQTFSKHTHEVIAVAFSPNGKTVLTGSKDNTAKLWDLSGQEMQTLKHDGEVTAVAFSPDGKTILTGSTDMTAKLWDLSGKEMTTFLGHTSEVTAVAFSPDGKTILTGSWDFTAKLWSLSGKKIQTFSGHADNINAVAFSPNGNAILTGSTDDTAKLWDLSGKELQTLSGHDSYISSVTFSPNGKNILTGSWDFTAKLWDLSGEEIQTFSGHDGYIYGVVFLPDGKNFLTGSGDGTAKLWGLLGNELQTFSGHKSNIDALAFSSDGKYILTGSRDYTAKLWDLLGNELRTFSGHSDYVTAVAFSPDGKYILTGSRDRKAKLWNQSGKKLRTFSGHSDYVSALAISSNRKYILTGSRDDTVRLWNSSGEKMRFFSGHKSYIDAVAFSSDGKNILSGGRDNTIRLWDLSGNELQNISENSDYNTISLSPDGKKILTGTKDKTGKKQRDFLSEELQTFGGETNEFTAIDFSPNGRMILTVNFHKNDIAKLWLLPQAFLDQKVHKFTLQELYDAGTILTEEDLKKVKQRDK